MCLRSLSAFLLLAATGVASEPQRVLRVCSDPNNLPFSNQAREGFENRIADLLAQRLGAKLEYTWWSQRKGFVRQSLGEHRCDVLLGVPSDLPGVLATDPYYRSTYVFVSRQDRHLAVSSLTDPRLATLRIGVHVVGDDYAPPASALARRGIVNVTGFSLFGPFGEPDPPSNLIRAVAQGEVDVAIVWGPVAGYFAQRQDVPLEIAPVLPEMFMAVPFTFRISAAVRSGETALKQELDRALEQDCAAIHKVLTGYGVPLMEDGTRCAPAPQSAASLR